MFCYVPFKLFHSGRNDATSFITYVTYDIESDSIGMALQAIKKSVFTVNYKISLIQVINLLCITSYLHSHMLFWSPNILSQHWLCVWPFSLMCTNSCFHYYLHSFIYSPPRSSIELSCMASA